MGSSARRRRARSGRGRRRRLQFGSVHLIERETDADVVLRYSFPATGLDDTALTTMLLLVLDGAADARGAVAGTPDPKENS